VATEKNDEIKIKFGQLAQPLKPFKCSKGVTLGQFLERRDLVYGASIRVNGEASNRETILKEGDIITNIENVNGGR
jgi:sulfur carrier protein ThiS